MPDDNDEEWMPVFALIARRQTRHAAHPDFKGTLPPDESEDVLQRIGTARAEGGAYLIQLTVLPLNGQLLLRPPRSEDRCDFLLRERNK